MDLATLSKITLADAHDVHKQLGEYWADHPVVLVFLRHFG